MEYQGKPVDIKELPAFIGGLPEGAYILDDTRLTVRETNQRNDNFLIPKSGLLKAIQSSSIPGEFLQLSKIHF